MGKRKKSLKQLTGSLMYFCLRKKKENDFPIPLINCNVTDNFWEKLQWDKDFQGIYSFELIEHFIGEYMLAFEKESIEDTDVEIFLDKLKEHLQLNLEEYWLISPLKGALLSKNIMLSDNLIFLDGNTDEGQVYLKNLIGDYYNYVTEKRFNADYKDVLICYKIKCQADYINDYYNVISYFLNAILHLYYYANVYPNYNYKENVMEYMFKQTCRLPMRDVQDTKRIILFSQRNPNLRLARYETNCKLDLSFFENAAHLTNFEEMTKYLLEEIPTQDKLVNKLLKVVRIFRSAVSSEENNILPGLSMAIVLFMTASEALYLKRDDAKRDSLKAIFASIYNGTDFSSIQIKEIIDSMYSQRSEFVHGGTITYRDYNDNFSSGPNTNLLSNFKKVFSINLYNIIQHILELDTSERTLKYFESYIDSHKVSEENTKQICFKIEEITVEEIEKLQILLNARKEELNSD